MDKQIKWIFKEDAKKFEWYKFRKVFFAQSTHNVKIDISALGRYYLYINGCLVCRGPVKSYDFRKFYDTENISSYLNPGENLIEIISQRIDRGGVYAEIYSSDGVICVSDETWDMRKYTNLSIETCPIAPPVEPFALCEEEYDARLESADEIWETPSFVHPELGGITKSVSGALSDIPILPKLFMGQTEYQDDKWGIRFTNPERIFHKIRKYTAEIYVCIVKSKTDLSVPVFLSKLGNLTINGVTVTDTACLKEGENLMVFSYFDATGDSEILFACERESLEFIPVDFGGKEGYAGVCTLDLNDNCFAWTYPDPDHFADENVREFFESILKAESLSHIAPFMEKFIPARLLDISVGFNMENVTLKGGFEEKKEYSNDTNLPSHTVSLFDFGAEELGYLELCIEAKEGTVIETEGFEVIDFNGIRHNHKSCMRYICKEGKQEHICFNKQGFRYLLIKTDGCVTLHSVSIRKSVCNVKKSYGFSCDDELLNRIYDMCTRTALSCMSDTYVDCPGFEQVYWVGDSKVTSAVNLTNFGEYGFDLNCLRIVADSMSDDYKKLYKNDNDVYFDRDLYLATPAFGNYVYGGLPMWSFSWIYQIFDYYMYSGDKEGLASIFPSVRKMLENCTKMMSDRGLFSMEGAWNLIEWSDNDLLPCGEVTANSAYLYLCLKKASYLAFSLSDEDYSKELSKRADDLYKAINRYCWDEKRGSYVDSLRDEEGYKICCAFFEKRGMKVPTFEEFKNLSRISEQTNTMCYVCGVVPDERKERVEKIIRRITDPEYTCFRSQPSCNVSNTQRDNEKIVTVGSPFFLYYTFAALSRFGDFSGMLDVIKREYGFMLECGTNSCWETFYNKGEDSWTRSICHGWGASPAVYFKTEICGVKPVSPGFTEFTFNPNTVYLSKISAEIPTPYGPISVEIDKDNGIENIDYPKECRLIK